MAMNQGPDWGLGQYERTAAALLPAARVVVDRAAPAAGERVVDVGCGTGNAALLAAERGAHVIGVDPATRLLEVARGEAARRALDVQFAEGIAEALPVGDGEADLVQSVFGVIFAQADPAAAELARVTAPEGRVVLSAWLPEGALTQVARSAREAVNAALDVPPAAPPFAWHDRDALAGLLGPYGFEVALEEESIAFSAASAGAYFDAEFEQHPLSVAARAVLEPKGEGEALRERGTAILEAANEDPDAFRLTSRYVVATARRG